MPENKDEYGDQGYFASGILLLGPNKVSFMAKLLFSATRLGVRLSLLQ